MLPDFPKVKRRTGREFFRQVEARIPALTPLLQGVAKFRQHEGRTGRIVRTDNSEGELNYPITEVAMQVDRESMRRFDPAAMSEKVAHLAKEFGAQQSRKMLETVSEAATQAGNVVSAGGQPVTQDMFLELFRRVEMDFDPVTLAPKPGFAFVMHPDMAESFLPKAKEWERDPVYNAKYERIMDQKRDEWRDREADRKLVR